MGLVQHASGTTGGTDAAALTVTLGSNTTPGNCLIVCITASNDSATPSVSGVTIGGSADNFTQAGSEVVTGSNPIGAFIWADEGIGVAATSVVITLAAAMGICADVYEWSGVKTSAAADKTNGGTTTSTGTWSSGATGTLSQASEVAFGSIGTINAHASTITGPGTPWTDEAQLSNTGGGEPLDHMSGYQQVSATTALTWDGTQSQTTQVTTAAVIVTLELAATGESGPFTPVLPKPVTSLTATVGHTGPFAIVLPGPATSLTSPGTITGPFNIVLPGPVTTLTSIPTISGPFTPTLPRPAAALTGTVVPIVTVVNQWANSLGQGTTFTSITTSLQSCTLQLDSTYNVGGGTGTPTAGNWLFAVASWTQDPSIEEVHVGVADDIRSWYREYPASSASGNTRTAIAYTPNLARVPGYVYCAPDGQVAAITLLVVEVSGLGPWDTVVTGAPDTSYAAAATSLALSLGAPGAPSFFIGAVGGDSTAATQAFAPSGWAGLHTVSQSDGSDQLASNYLTSAYLASSSSAQSVSGTAGSATDLSGFLLGVYVTGTSPVPAGQNPAWPYMIFEAGFGSGFNTPDSEITWTDITTRLWSWDETTGIEYNLGQLQSTDLTMEIDNYDAALTSTNTSSPYYPDVQPGTPLRLRAAIGTPGGVTVNRWYVLQRNAAQWGEAVDETYRRYCEVSGTDLWAALSDTPPSFYRNEIYADNPYAWWPCDDQPGTAGVQPTALLNAALGNTSTLGIYVSPDGAQAELPWSVGAFDGVPGPNVGPASGGLPPTVPVYTAGADAGWMFGDPQGQPASLGTGNPVSSTPGSAAWQASGQLGDTGSYGWFLAVNDAGFPALSGGITVECWFNYLFLGTSVTSTFSEAGEIGDIACGQPRCPLTILELATGSAPVALLQLDITGHLDLITYNGSTGTSHSIYTASDLRSGSWHMITVTMTATAWTVYVDGGALAQVSGTATGMTSAWTWLIANGDLGSNGGSTAGTGLVHGGNASLAHIAVYPLQLPYWRVMAHYWAAVSGFGQIPAPEGITVQMVTAGTANGIAAATPDGSTGSISTPTGNPWGYTGTGSYGGSSSSSEGGSSYSAIVTAVAGSYTSGPSARGTGYGFGHSIAAWVGWSGLAPEFYVYNAATAGSEQQAALTAGSGDAFLSGFGSSATAQGVCHVSGGSGASPPASPSAIGDTVGQRIERLMRGGLTTSPNRCIDPAPLLVQAPGLAGGGTQAGAAIQAIQQSDSGMLFIDNLNNLTYWQRPHLAAQYSSPVWVLGPDTGSGQTPYYLQIRWITDPQHVYNVIGVTPQSPTGAALAVITPADASGVDASQKTYGPQPYAVTSWLQSLTAMQAQADWLFSTYGTPQRRAEHVMIDAAPYPAAWELVMGVGIGDVVTLADWQIGGGGTVHTYRVTELKRVLSFGTHNSDVTGHVELTLDREPSSYWT